jgi:hypothetical protein
MRILRRGAVLAPAGYCLLMLLTLLPAGCAAMGVLANAMPEPDVAARYTGLAGHTVAVMVWADRGMLIDYPSMRLDVASGIQSKIQEAQHAKKKELTNTRFPFAPASVVRFQEDHPEIHDQSVTDPSTFSAGPRPRRSR